MWKFVIVFALLSVVVLLPQRVAYAFFFEMVQVIINYLVDQAEKRATSSRKKADQVY